MRPRVAPFVLLAAVTLNLGLATAVLADRDEAAALAPVALAPVALAPVALAPAVVVDAEPAGPVTVTAQVLAPVVPVATPLPPPPAPPAPAVPPPAPAPPVAPPPPVEPDPRGCDGAGGWEQRRGELALQALGYPVGDLRYAVEFLPGRQGVQAVTYSTTRTIEMYVRTCAQQSDGALLFTLAHEVGHAVDFSSPSYKRQDDWLAARGATGTGWYGCSGCSDFATGAGDFAEVFALAHTGVTGVFASQVAGPPDAAQLEVLRPMMRPGY